MIGLFLQPDAAQVISAMPIDERVKHHALEVIEKGYTLVKGALPQEECAAAIAAFRAFESANEAVFSPHRDAYGHYPRCTNLHMAVPDLLKLFSRNSLWLAVQDVLFGAPTALYTSLFFEVGSQQSLHRDTPVFCTRPDYLYFGTTVYLEASDDDNGCLEVMEGGHTMPELDRPAIAAARYGDARLTPDIDWDLWDDYQQRVAEQGRAFGLELKRLHAEPGDSVIWHPQLPHGGTTIRDQTRTRMSFVMHTTPVGIPVYHMPGFFNPDVPLPETAQWQYKPFEGRSVALVQYGISIGEQDYPLHALTDPNALVG